ncbi:YdbC family protein [Terrilactibacillus laevilacticus]|uniref:YdbC family protein n=1 Tax=Terrilactibacillus laevilacticus TaxID=1380157 RepID=A0ABW5PNF4_9BACI|nr:YdbC family protein [Terrilactibacillus laevilacticus]
MADIKYEIIKTIGELSESPKGWKKQLNLISWNGREPKYDLRDWSPDGTKMGKGVTLSTEDLKALKAIFNQMDGLD